MCLTSEKEENKLKNHQNIFVDTINQIFMFLKYIKLKEFSDIIITKILYHYFTNVCLSTQISSSVHNNLNSTEIFKTVTCLPSIIP